MYRHIRTHSACRDVYGDLPADLRTTVRNRHSHIWGECSVINWYTCWCTVYAGSGEKIAFCEITFSETTNWNEYTVFSSFWKYKSHGIWYGKMDYLDTSMLIKPCLVYLELFFKNENILFKNLLKIDIIQNDWHCNLYDSLLCMFNLVRFI